MSSCVVACGSKWKNANSLEKGGWKACASRVRVAKERLLARAHESGVSRDKLRRLSCSASHEIYVAAADG